MIYEIGIASRQGCTRYSIEAETQEEAEEIALKLDDEKDKLNEEKTQTP